MRAHDEALRTEVPGEPETLPADSRGRRRRDRGHRAANPEIWNLVNYLKTLPEE